MDTELAPQPAGGVQPQAQPPSLPSQASSLDPGVLALEKQIGLAESGGDYTAGDSTGDGAKSNGAFQMTPGFLENWAPKSGIQYTPGQQLTPQQQNEIAYNTIYTLGTSGDPADPSLGKLNPSQIASYWNTGDPQAYTDPTYGENNTYGSTENYVNKIMDGFNSSLGINTANAATNPTSDTSNASGSSPSLADWILGGVGALGAGISAAWPYISKPLTDAGVDAGIAAVTTGPEDFPGEAIGAGVGLAQGIAQDFTGGTSAPSAPTDTGTTAATDTGANDLPPEPQANPSTKTQTTSPTPSSPVAPAPDENIVASNQAAKAIVQGTQEMLQPTISGRKTLADKNGQAGIEEMGINGYIPEVDENHVADYSNALKQNQKDIGSVHDDIAPMLAAEGSTGDVDETVNDAIKDMNMKKGYTESDREEAAKAIRAEAEKYHKNYGNGGKKVGNRKMSTAHFDKMRSETGSGRKWDMTESNAKREAMKSLSMAARRTVEKNTKHKELYNRAMKKTQRLVQARNIMKKLDKKKVPMKSSLLHSALKAGGKYLGTYIGDKIGGPLGAILGTMVGDYVTRATDKKFGKTIFESPAVHRGLQDLQKKAPQAYKVIAAELKKAGIAHPLDPDMVKATSKAQAILKAKQKEKLQDFEPPLPPSSKKQSGLIPVPGTRKVQSPSKRQK
jgi:hypothetical protein